MTTPHGVSQPTHPGSMSHGLAWSVVVVKSVDPERNIAVVQDQLTKTFHMPLNSLRAKGLPPAVDEQWLISREYGPWAFVLLLNGKPEGEQVPQALVERLPADLAELQEDVADAAPAPEAWVFGDYMSSMSRLVARDPIGFATGNTARYVLLGPSGGITVAGASVSVVTSGVAPSRPISIGLYLGDSLADLDKVAVGSVIPNSVDVRNTWLGLGDDIVIPRGKIVAMGFITDDTVVRLSGVALGGNPGILVPQMGYSYQGFTADTALPNNINFMRTGPMWISAQRLWCALW